MSNKSGKIAANKNLQFPKPNLHWFILNFLTLINQANFWGLALVEHIVSYLEDCLDMFLLYFIILALQWERPIEWLTSLLYFKQLYLLFCFE